MLIEVKNQAVLQQALDELCAFLLASNISSDLIFDSKLVACELLSNVLLHANGNAKLKGEIKNGFIELKVFSPVTFVFPQKRSCPEALAEHGRGLFLVDSVCGQRVYSEQDGIRVLIEIK